MNTKLFSFLSRKGNSFHLSFWLVGLALIVGLVLSILSWLELCVQHCTANQDYLLFGFPFAIVGMIFFLILIVLHILSIRYSVLSKWTGWLIASALGAEIMFLIVQRYEIGHWCPVCLSIAASVGAASLVLLIGYSHNLYMTIQNHNRENMMQKIKQGLISLSFIVLGFLAAFIGIANPNSAEAAMNDIRERLAFGSPKSSISVYFVTDWFCPSCKKVEPQVERAYSKIKSKVAFYFIDFPIHKKSLNFTPYNIAFLINNKPEYFKARQVLTELAEETQTPNDSEVAKTAKQNGIQYKDLSFLEIKTGMDFFDQIIEEYDVRATPTLIVVNNRNNKMVKLEGRDEISEDKIIKAVEKIH